MSSSNLVRLAVIEETIYGETPAAGDFATARFTSDSLSGTPETTESQQIRTDRMSSGQVVTGLTVGGDVNTELAKEVVMDSFFASAMYNNWQTPGSTSVDLTIDVTAKTITRAVGDFTVNLKIGDLLTLGSFVNSGNNTEVMVIEVTSATVIKYVGSEGMVDETGSGTTYQLNDYLDIGATKKSFSMEKTFLDLTDKAINYKGMIASNMSLSVAHGEIINTTFSFQGNNYQAVNVSGDFLTDGRTITAAATSNSLNGSVDMPFLINSAVGTLEESTFCIQSMEMSLNNNLTAQNCIGETAPVDYSEGTAQIEISLTAYLSNDNWPLLAKKLSQEPFSIGFTVKNNDGHYGFFFPAVQVSFEDPASAGQNQDVFLNMSGVAKVGSNSESAVRIFKG